MKGNSCNICINIIIINFYIFESMNLSHKLKFCINSIDWNINNINAWALLWIINKGEAFVLYTIK